MTWNIVNSGDVGGLPEVTPAEDTQQGRKRPGVERIYRSWRLVWKGSPSTPIQGTISEHVESCRRCPKPKTKCRLVHM